ncbi:hypothetical protein P3T76_009912 [Phytophthora citrophthora]|uniref:Uncharacterized protein n=1 Tax=Phytophthora citrophthora TaxID=4793 RepID=A0AAD9LIY6_9STRA|nr:hypothetical protein P3T76_009912 [Phytophthora citrophthora]
MDVAAEGAYSLDTSYVPKYDDSESNCSRDSDMDFAFDDPQANDVNNEDQGEQSTERRNFVLVVGYYLRSRQHATTCVNVTNTSTRTKRDTKHLDFSYTYLSVGATKIASIATKFDSSL